MTIDHDVMTRAEIRHALIGNSAYWSYPGKWDESTDDYMPRSIALDGKFSLDELERLVSILKRAGPGQA